MAAPRLLPPVSDLERLVRQGYTHQQIVDWWQATSGITVSRSSVSAALSRAGLSKESARYKDELPWRVKGEHLTQYPARMLRLLGRRRAGNVLADEEIDRLDAWLEALSEKGLVVGYCPQFEGFLYVEADEVDDGADGVPIRRRLIGVDEVEG